jgi:type IV pilus assembly protein PilB
MSDGFSWQRFLGSPTGEGQPKQPVGGAGEHRSPDASRGSDSNLGRLLLAHRLLTEEQLREAFEAQIGTRDPLAAVVVRLGMVTAAQLTAAQAAQKGLRSWDPDKEPAEADALRRVPGHVCRTHLILPVREKNQLLSLAMSNPENMGAIDAVRALTGLRVEPLLADEDQLLGAIEKHHGVRALQESFESLISQAEKDFKTSLSTRKSRAALTEADTRPVVGLVNHVLTWAIRMGASDVHLEPRHDRVDVRFRVDGELQKVQELPQSLMPMLTTRLKIMAELDIVEFRVPQDGRVSVNLDGRTVDLRMSVLPNHHGQRVVLRILDKSIALKKLDELGFSAEELSSFRKMVRRPYGMLLVTGPTGSGKTTTLYAALQELNRVGRNIMTCEDPIEYEIDGINQSQVNEKVGLTFAAQLRATLRQDPDVILVGEIRDRETAETAIRAALTGHFVLSTLHCNDAPGAIPRLLDMGVDPYLLSTCLVGVTAQRLVRTLCPHCSVIADGDSDYELLIEAAGTGLTDGMRKAVGCPQCFGTGFRGRSAVHEVLHVTAEVAAAIASQEPIPAVRALAQAAGYVPLQVEVMRRVISGQTTLSEAMRLIAFDLESQQRLAA